MTRKRLATQSKIKQAYIKLLKTHDPLNISIKEICLECNINRSTFYEYYSYIDLLIKDVIYDQIDQTSNDNNAIYDAYYFNNTTGPENVAKYMQNIANNNVLMNLIKSSEGNKFKAEITNAQCNYEINRYKIKDPQKITQVIYRNSGVLTIVFNWIEKQTEMDLKEISTMLYNEIRKTEQYK